MADHPDHPARELLRQRAAGAEPADLAAVAADTADVQLAVQVAGRLEQERRRALAMHLLVDTAHELAAATDPDGVLDAIVRRARGLLGTDVAYLTMYDEAAGDTYMRATDGAVAPTFRNLRLDLGVGLGGLVASTRQSWWTDDYPHDQRFEHTATIDGGVGDEGLVAICGTPLVVEDEFVGVLFAANRQRHVFTPDDVALLSSLAALAAVSILQTRARRATESALAAVSALHAQERARAVEIERSAAAHDRFTHLVVAGGGVDGLARDVAELLGGWVVVVDADGARLCASGAAPAEEVGADGVDALARTDLVRDARESDRAVHGHGRYAVASRASSDSLAVLVCEAEADTALARSIVERAAAVTALLLLFQRQTAAARHAALSDRVAEFVSGRLGPVEAARLLRREGFDPSLAFCLVVFRSHDQPISSLLLTAGAAVAPYGLVAEHARAGIALVPGSSPGELADRLARRVDRAGGVTAAGVGPLASVADLPRAYREARRTLDAMIALGHTGRGAAATELGFTGLIVGSTPDISDFVTRTIGPLISYDARRRTDLVATVQAYFEAGASPRRAAGLLHVHPNTVAQRLERIADLLGPDWAAPDSALEIQLALKLRRLLPADAAEAPPGR